MCDAVKAINTINRLTSGRTSAYNGKLALL